MAKNWATAYATRRSPAGLLKKEEIPNEVPTGMQGFVFNTRRPIFQRLARPPRRSPTRSTSSGATRPSSTARTRARRATSRTRSSRRAACQRRRGAEDPGALPGQGPRRDLHQGVSAAHDRRQRQHPGRRAGAHCDSSGRRAGPSRARSWSTAAGSRCSSRSCSTTPRGSGSHSSRRTSSGSGVTAQRARGRRRPVRKAGKTTSTSTSLSPCGRSPVPRERAARVLGLAGARRSRGSRNLAGVKRPGRGQA